MLKLGTHYEQVPLTVIQKVLDAAGKRWEPARPLLSPKKKTLARHPKVAVGGRL